MLLILSACSTAATQAPPQAPMMDTQHNAVSSEAYAAGNSVQKDAAAIASPGQVEITRMVIKNADLIIVVEDPAVAMTTITEMAGKLGGYVVSSKSYKTHSTNGIEVPQANISIRVTADKLNEAIAQIKGLTKNPAQDVTSENVSGQDVTADYVDLKSQLTNLESTEKKLQQFLDSATKTEEVLAVFNQLTQVRQQIEQIKGRMKYIEESAALSAINVQLLSKAGIAPISVAGWEPVGVARDAFQALIDVGKFLVELLIWLVILFLPLGLVFYFPGRWLWRLIKKNSAKKAPLTMPYPNMPYPPSGPTGPIPPTDLK
jgi:hypothetical protein